MRFLQVSDGNHDMTPQLISPAGNWDCARAAVAAGADAIYFGLPRFNARMRADNFTDEDLEKLMNFLHRHGVRGFVTMNTLIFPGELEAAVAQIRKMSEAKVDAMIVQDLGLAKLAHTFAPNLALHASTQMTISSPEGLEFVESLCPLQCAVLARELSVSDLGKFPLSSTTLEVFVHGALCVAYSGQCLTSESLGQRSANRGECAQACRMPYEIVVDGEIRDLGEVRYLLSPQDLAAVDLIPDLVRAGVRSFKIEGRLKSPEYVTAVTRVYRKALDAVIAQRESPVNSSDRYALEMTFSRGLSTGWLAGTNHPYLTHGKFGKKRGPLLGEIIDCGNGWIKLGNTTGIPIAPGDGVVFDAGENRDLEQGAHIWKIEGNRLIFHIVYSGINFNRIEPGHTVYKTSDPKLESELRKFWQNTRPPEKKTPLHFTVSGKAGEHIVLKACFQTDGELTESIKVSSSIQLEPATKRSLDSSTLTTQLGRLGDTSYVLASLDNQLEGGCYCPLSALNQLRRDLVAMLESNNKYRAPTPLPVSTSHHDLLPLLPTPDSSHETPSLSVLCRTREQLDAAIENAVGTIYLDYEDTRRFKDSVAHIRSQSPNTNSKVLLATPRILKPGETGFLKVIEQADPDGVLLRNLSALNFYQNKTGFCKVVDFSLNVANPITAKLLMDKVKPDYLTISYDLNIGQVMDLLQSAPPGWFELTLHQHMPMFHMEHCVFCAFLGKGTSARDCGRPCDTHIVHLRDRVGQLHRLQADVGCRNTLFNGRAQTGARFFAKLRDAGLRKFRLELLDEDAAMSSRVIRTYQNLFANSIDAEDAIRQVDAIEKLGVTEGTLLEK